jgi:hypothetical protein
MSEALVPQLAQEHVTHTYTSPVGAVVVILGVPALIDLENPQDYAFTRIVAKRVQEIIQDSLALNSAPNSVTSHAYEDNVNLPAATVEIIFRGEDVQYGRIPLRVLRQSLERVDSSYHLALSGYSEHKNLHVEQLSEPIVLYLRKGSLVVALRSTDQPSPFAEVIDAGYESMRLILDTVAWLNGDKNALGHGITDDSELFDSLLKAAEVLAPTERDVFREVEIVATSRDKPKSSNPIRERVALSTDTRLRAATERRIIAQKVSRTRQVVFTGVIDGLKERDVDTREGIVHIKVKTSPEDFTSGVAEFVYDNIMLRGIVRAFDRGGEHQFRALQREVRGKWRSKGMQLLELQPVNPVQEE